jgi:phospholipid/cholesterol/gamma-HCH transport system permease protein
VLAALGRRSVGITELFGHLGHFVADTLRAVPDVRTWGRQLFPMMRRIGVDSLPIALFIAAFTGVVLALLASYTVTAAVPLYFVGSLVGKTTMLELGPVLTGLALAGRVGANIAAELGTMRVTEQVDALETLAYDPHAYLVLPRVIAGTLMFPIIVAFAMAMAIFMGWLAATTLLPITTAEFLRGLRLFYVPFDVQFGLIKASSFGFVITLIGCFLGLNTRGGAEGVGDATTRTVVYSAEMILVLDAYWALTLLRPS